MADISAALSSEITRILQCIYPASLFNLSKLLAQTSIPAIRATIYNRSRCHVKRLATIVYDALEQAAYTLHVLHRLSYAPEFRDELLIAKPDLLHALLKKANSSKSDFEHYAGLCVLLLSRQPPDGILLPAEAQGFFLNSFQKAIQAPSVDTLRSVYCMLNGACRGLHSLLPSDVRRKFDAGLCGILKSNAPGESSMLLSWVCGIVFAMEHPEGATSIQTPNANEQPVSTESLEQRWKTISGQKLFGSMGHLYKTISLVCTNVMKIIYNGATDDDAIDIIRIASRVLQFVDQDVKNSWAKQDQTTRTLFKKFAEKITGLDTSSPLVLEVLSFYAVLSGSRGLPLGLVERYEECLSNFDFIVDPESASELLSVSLPLFAIQMEESSIQRLLIGVLDACASRPSSRQLFSLVNTVDKLTTAATTQEALRNKVLRALSSQTILEKSWSLIHIDFKDHATGCCTYAASLHRQLVATTIASLLVVAFAADVDAPKLPNALIVALIKKQQDLPPIISACSHSLENSPPSSISLFQQASTQYTGQHLQEWKERINSVVDSQSRYQKELFTREVAKYCEDLETRCNTVEEPLRREEERSKRLEGQVERLLSDIESLSKQREDDMHYQEGLEKDLEDAKDYRNRAELEQRRMCEEKEDMSAKLQDMEEALERTNRQAEDMLNAAQEDFAEKEANLRSTLLQYEDDKSHRDAEMESLRITISQLRESQAQWENDHHTLAEEHQRLRARCCDTEELLEKEREKSICQADELSCLESRLSEHQQDLEYKETELRNANERLDQLQDSHEKLKRESEERFRDLATKHANSLKAAMMKAEEEREEIEDRLQNALQAIEHETVEHEKTSGEAQRLRETISPLKFRIQELQKICTEQEEELESLRTWHTEMLAHLKQPLNVRPASRSYKDAIQPQPTEERTHRRRKSTKSSQDVAQKAAKSPQVLTDTTMNKAADDSFVSPTDSYSSQGDGPAPKRPKPQSTFKVPAMHTPYTRKPDLMSKSVSNRTSPSKRSALRQMSPNRRHTVGLAMADEDDESCVDGTQSMRQRSSSLQDDEQAAFGMDDDFTSGTPLTPGYAAGTGRAPEDDDGTMTEL
ncbi:hypothetical protein P3342_011214 [Pyrenophora teres f. teres]|nr:hypothetical protein HRS9139_06184 [Pyrenophora teres f. teres]KAE8858222.1 hypothetical protein PTNB29_07437 [Pyrenophora teres f. teres]KAK1909136.1 hypothetical protein P3342_011214 [Pyrenophora teres f. teres]